MEKFKRMILKGVKIVVYIILLICALTALLPLYWMFITAVQLPGEIFLIPPRFVPAIVTEAIPLWLQGAREEALYILTESLDNIKILFTRVGIHRWLLNSILVSGIVTLGILFLDSMAGYAFAKKRFPGRNIIFWMMISAMMIPSQILLVPMFILITRLGFHNTLVAVILPPLGMVFGVFLMRQLIQSISTELLDAARIDGASEFGIYWQIVLPLSKPALATLGIITFVAVWNSFLWPLVVLHCEHLFTLPVGLKTLQDKHLADFGLLMSGASIAAIPMIVVFLCFQKYFIKGLSFGGLKG